MGFAPDPYDLAEHEHVVITTAPGTTIPVANLANADLDPIAAAFLDHLQVGESWSALDDKLKDGLRADIRVVLYALMDRGWSVTTPDGVEVVG